MTGRWAREVLEYSLSRRAFLQAVGISATAAAFGTLGCVGASGPSPSPAASLATPTPGNMIVATEADPVKLVDGALDAFGGLSGIVKKGDRVMVKANFSFARTMDEAASNHPQVLVRIMERCKDAGASEVVVFDHTIDNPVLCMENSGIKSAVEKAGFKIKAINSISDFENTPIPGTALKYAYMAKLLKDADVLINAPVIKSHSSTRLTAGMKNLMGIVWNRQDFHLNDLDACIADLAAYSRPSLIIADAYRVLRTGGPQGGSPGDQVIEPHQLIVGRDPVAVDSYAATLIGLTAGDIDHIVKAYNLGLGESDLSKVPIEKVGSK